MKPCRPLWPGEGGCSEEGCVRIHSKGFTLESILHRVKIGVYWKIMGPQKYVTLSVIKGEDSHIGASLIKKRINKNYLCRS